MHASPIAVLRQYPPTVKKLLLDIAHEDPALGHTRSSVAGQKVSSELPSTPATSHTPKNPTSKRQGASPPGYRHPTTKCHPMTPTTLTLTLILPLAAERTSSTRVGCTRHSTRLSRNPGQNSICTFNLSSLLPGDRTCRSTRIPSAHRSTKVHPRILTSI